MSKGVIVYLGTALLRRLFLSKDVEENTARVLCPLPSGLPGAGGRDTECRGMVTGVCEGQEGGFASCSRLVQEWRHRG